MGIKVIHGTPTAALAGSFAAGLGKRDVRNQSVYMKQANIEQARQDAKTKQFQDYSYRGYLEKMRQTSYAQRDAAQRTFAGEQADKQNEFRAGESALDRKGRAGIAEGKSRAASKAGDLNFAQGQHDTLYGRIGDIRKQSGGKFSDPILQKKWDDIEKGLPAINAQTGEKFTNQETLEFGSKKMQEFLNDYNPDMITPPKDREGGSWTDEAGRKWQRDEKGNKVFDDWESREKQQQYLDNLPTLPDGSRLYTNPATGKETILPPKKEATPAEQVKEWVAYDKQRKDAVDAQTLQGEDKKSAQDRVDKTLPPRPFPGTESNYNYEFLNLEDRSDVDAGIAPHSPPQQQGPQPRLEDRSDLDAGIAPYSPAQPGEGQEDLDPGFTQATAPGPNMDPGFTQEEVALSSQETPSQTQQQASTESQGKFPIEIHEDKLMDQLQGKLDAAEKAFPGQNPFSHIQISKEEGDVYVKRVSSSADKEMQEFSDWSRNEQKRHDADVNPPIPPIGRGILTPVQAFINARRAPKGGYESDSGAIQNGRLPGYEYKDFDGKTQYVGGKPLTPEEQKNQDALAQEYKAFIDKEEKEQWAKEEKEREKNGYTYEDFDGIHHVEGSASKEHKNTQNESRKDKTLEDGITKREDGTFEFNGRKIVRREDNTPSIQDIRSVRAKVNAYRTGALANGARGKEEQETYIKNKVTPEEWDMYKESLEQSKADYKARKAKKKKDSVYGKQQAARKKKYNDDMKKRRDKYNGVEE